MSWMDSLVRRIDEAATLPVIATEVLRLCDNPHSNAQNLADAISNDPALAAKIVRTANSAFFGLAHKVTSIRGAVVRLGLKTIRNTVLGLSVAKLFSAPVEADGYSRPGVWKHSIAVAILNQLLAETCRLPGLRPLADEAFLVGLVHDIGIILEDQYMPKRFSDFPALAWKLRQPLHVVEKKDLGFNHADLGSAVLKKWKFPERMVKAVAWHHQPAKAGGEEVTLLTAMSEVLVVVKKAGYCDLPFVTREEIGTLAKRLQLGAREMAAIKGRFEERLAQAMDIFGLTAEEAPTHRTGYDLSDEAAKASPPPAS